MKTKSHMDGRTGGGGGGGGEFFICFTARPSSSSASCAAVMRVPSSKSLMSPGRGGRDAATAPPSLSASLSRRLRSSGSVKGLQSPMFPSGAATGGGRRKGCAFEAAEPSSPKVTCIGQVRVKTKKKKKRAQTSAAIAAVARSRSQRSVEASFRDREIKNSGGGNWVQQIPVSICEALRALGDFNCLLPCSGRSFCSSSSKDAAVTDRQKVATEDKSSSSCSAVLARWLMAVHESEEGKRSEVMGLVVGDRCIEKSLAEELQERKSMAAEEEEEVEQQEEEAAARVSVCIPPKNALLLMRCRSDPVKMAALATRFWDSPAMRADNVAQDQTPATAAAAATEDDYDDMDGNGYDGNEGDVPNTLREEDMAAAAFELVEESISADFSTAITAEKSLEEVNVEEEEEEDEQEEEDDKKEEDNVVDDERLSNFADRDEASTVMVQEEEKEEVLNDDNKEAAEQDDPPLMVEEREEVDRRSPSSCSSSSTPTTSCRQKLDGGATGGGWSTSVGLSKARDKSFMRRSMSAKEKERRRHSFSSEKESRRHSFSTDPETGTRRTSFSVDTTARRRWSFSIVKDEQQQVAPPTQTETEEDKLKSCMIKPAMEPAKTNGEGGGGGDGEKRRELPDCLLLMMYEPKLSMEVSKETWVCSTDFLHWRPHQSNKPQQDDKTMEKKILIAAQQQQQTLDPLPPPVPPPLTVSTAKVVPAPPMPPAVVLKRCKSEPMRASARLAPVDACFWKSRHQPIGAIGF